MDLIGMFTLADSVQLLTYRTVNILLLQDKLYLQLLFT
jgi:hypothetical protein